MGGEAAAPPPKSQGRKAGSGPVLAVGAKQNKWLGGGGWWWRIRRL